MGNYFLDRQYCPLDLFKDFFCLENVENIVSVHNDKPSNQTSVNAPIEIFIKRFVAFSLYNLHGSLPHGLDTILTPI